MGVPLKIGSSRFPTKNRNLLQLKKPKEQNIQSTVVTWFKLQYPKALFTASAGGLHTSKSQGSKMKAAGYVKGCPDLLIFEPRGGYFGLMIEMKREGGRATPEQIVFIEQLRQRNYFAVVCTGSQEAMNVISKFMSSPMTSLS